MLLDVPRCKAKDFFLWSALINATSLMLAGPMPSLMLVVGDTLIKDVKSKLINVPSVIVCDSVQEMILKPSGCQKDHH